MHVKRASVNASQSSKSIQKRPEMYLEKIREKDKKYHFVKPKSRYEYFSCSKIIAITVRMRDFSEILG